MNFFLYNQQIKGFGMLLKMVILFQKQKKMMCVLKNLGLNGLSQIARKLNLTGLR